jgi:hypothetical protein
MNGTTLIVGSVIILWMIAAAVFAFLAFAFVEAGGNIIGQRVAVSMLGAVIVAPAFWPVDVGASIPVPLAFLIAISISTKVPILFLREWPIVLPSMTITAVLCWFGTSLFFRSAMRGDRDVSPR